MTIRSTITAIAAVAAITTGIATTAQARSISLDGYNLNSVEDIDRLHREVVATVKRECVRELHAVTHGVKYHQVRKCIKEATDQTIDEAGLPMLSRFHASTDEQYRYIASRPSLTSRTLAAQ